METGRCSLKEGVCRARYPKTTGEQAPVRTRPPFVARRRGKRHGARGTGAQTRARASWQKYVHIRQERGLNGAAKMRACVFVIQ